VGEFYLDKNVIRINSITKSLNTEKSNNAVYLQCVIVDKILLLKKRLIANPLKNIFLLYIFLLFSRSTQYDAGIKPERATVR